MCQLMTNMTIVQRQIFEAHNFRGLAFSKISQKQFSRIEDSISISTVFKNFPELNFRGSMPIREKRENDAPRKFGAIRYM